jgi:hypothetical protein
MSKKLITFVFTATIFTMALLPALSNAGNGRMAVQSQHSQASCTHQLQGHNQICSGSCLTSGASGSGAKQKNGSDKNYGPGDGTGNSGIGPKDGTGYAPNGKK